ncbi:MAG: hypothetical protein H6624_15195 [Bdellovibrionaceae bacterium]|nr:hypothetical protein [Bdellovibrionales bacterium]MCB9085691.1 hypothetical protein [Pseudobdellovibrionaceae bacterium]
MNRLILVTLLVGLSSGALAAEKKAKASGTDLSFEDLLIQGRYHFSNESVVTVEEEKVFSKLLKIRKDFDDRVEDSADQN